MGFFRIPAVISLFFWLLIPTSGLVASVQSDQPLGNQTLRLENRFLSCDINIQDGILVSDLIKTRVWPAAGNLITSWQLKTDGNFRLEIVWTGWRAPGKPNNANNQMVFNHRDFRVIDCNRQKKSGGLEVINIFLKGQGNPFELKITYALAANAFYLRRRISIRDSGSGKHFLQWVWPRYGFLDGDFKALKRGGFGQPLVLAKPGMAAFLGLEYPAAVNKLIAGPNRKVGICCGQVMGKPVGKDWIVSEWVVHSLTPQRSVKTWFMNYLDDIRVAPLKPYILYNTWYDLRAPEMVKKAENILNEENVMRIIKLFEDNLVKPFGLSLNAFVLDDGWDVYSSDWQLRTREFPRGLKPISDYLKKKGTALGIWLGPTGGYSHRDRRIKWMKQNGYEVVGDQLCLAGSRYKKLFRKRVAEFVKRDKLGYFKWDGIQFSCSEPGHGHPAGIFSRRAVMESVMELCQTVREADPDIFLNITSGTWLSPWWVKYANTIWMQGHDYGYADVPSISRRDRAMTYRDVVLFEGLRKNDFWFPMANLMTHGIIKGHLQMLGGETEPLDKFTDNALLYVARGVSIWELYVSPDLLTPGEWQAMAKSILWAQDRFPILTRTEMIGGDPGQQQAYGYMHASGNRAVIAVRNPVIDPAIICLQLNFDPARDNSNPGLVLERIYPTRWVSPQLVGSGDELKISLMGFETAVYDLYPLSEATVPLLAGAVFETDVSDENSYRIRVLQTGSDLRILNPKCIKSLSSEGKPVDLDRLNFRKELSSPVLDDEKVQLETCSQGYCLKVRLKSTPSMESGQLAVLFENQNSRDNTGLHRVQVLCNGQDLTPGIEEQKGKWQWIKIPVAPGCQAIEILFSASPGLGKISGNLSVWLIARQRLPLTRLTFELHGQYSLPPQPPRPWPRGIVKQTIKLKEFSLQDQ